LGVGRFGGPHAPIDGHALTLADGLAVEQKQSLVAAPRVGDVLLNDHVAELLDGRQDLVEVGVSTALDEKHGLDAAARERFDDGRPAQLLEKLLDRLVRARDERTRPDRLRQARQVHATTRALNALGVVDYERAAQTEPPAELDRR